MIERESLQIASQEKKKEKKLAAEEELIVDKPIIKDALYETVENKSHAYS